MTCRKIYLASPAEPSGASWIINCLLELGIRVNHKPAVDRLWRTSHPLPAPSRMWLEDGLRCRLHPRAEVLGKWLPALSRYDAFSFRDDVLVEYVQEFPGPHHIGQPVLFFLRDPRDSIYSMYCRRQPCLDFPQFCRFPHPETLLPAADHWLLYVQSWRVLAGDRLFRFEDYKRDATGLLRTIVSSLALGCPEPEIQRAAAESSFEKAAAAEALYRERHPGDREVANRAGRVGDWRDRPEVLAAVANIERRCGALLRELGYDVPAEADDPQFRAAANFHFLDVFRHSVLPPETTAVRSLEPFGHESLNPVLNFLYSLDERLLADAHLSPKDSRTLLASLDEFARTFHGRLSARIQALERMFSDGSEQHLDAVRELLKRSRKARSNTADPHG